MDELKMHRPLTEGYTGVIETLEQDPFPLLNAALRTRMTLQSEAIGVESHNIPVRTSIPGGGFTFTNVSVPAWVIRLGGGYKGIIPITAAGLLKLPVAAPADGAPDEVRVDASQAIDVFAPSVLADPPKAKKKRKSALDVPSDKAGDDAHLNVSDDTDTIPTPIAPLLLECGHDDDSGDNGEALFDDRFTDQVITLSASASDPVFEFPESIESDNGKAKAVHQSAWKANIEAEKTIEHRILDVYLSLSRTEKIKVRRKMESMLGGLLVFRVLHIEQEGCLVLLSRRLALQSMADATWSKLRIGQKVIATTKKVLKWHAFCDIGGIVATLPVNEIINGHLTDARTMLRENTTYEVLIKSLDKESGRVILSMKELTSDPWLNAIRLYHKGSRHMARITGLLPGGGFFVQLEPGVDLLTPRPLFSLTGGPQVAIGDRVLVAIQRLDMDKRRIHGKILLKK